MWIQGSGFKISSEKAEINGPVASVLFGVYATVMRDTSRSVQDILKDLESGPTTKNWILRLIQSIRDNEEG